MNFRRFIPRDLQPVVLLVAFVLLIILAVILTRKWQDRNAFFQDDFMWESNAQPHERGWQQFGGAWQVLDGTMQNLSDDRGAKLVNGNPRWQDYSVEADVQLLSETGDAGFVVRTNDEEVGVDAYHGYFAGLRDLDDTLILGRADFGWHEFGAVAVHSRVHTRTWYHLKVIAYRCVIAARATTPEGEQEVISVEDPDCVRTGRFGLQSYSTGAVWRHLHLQPATADDLSVLLGGAKPQPPVLPNLDAAGLPVNPPMTDLASYQTSFGPMLRQLRDNHADPNASPIASLRLLPPNVSPHSTIHGVVTMVSPLLYVQDSSGGIAIPDAHPVIPVQIGDAVEASGNAEMHNFSSVLRDATVRLLWSHTQVPPVSVTASQAATGGFDAELIETEGRLTSAQMRGPRSILLQFDEGSQSFVALAENLNNAATIQAIKPNSRLRVRGICATDKAFTGDQVPFALLMRSAGDIQVLEPPPWWSPLHILELTSGLILLSLGIQFLYASSKRAQLRAVMEERERLAMEMHDTLAQSFAGLGFQLEALCSDARPDSDMRKQLESTLDLVRFGHTQARRDIASLRPGKVEDLGLPMAMEQAAQKIVRGAPIEISLSTRGVSRPIPLRISDALFRIGQEAVANAVRHARPSHIALQISYGKSSVMLKVKDDGNGFESDKEDAGFGIRSMRDRAERISAIFRVRSIAGVGTVVSVRARAPHKLFTAWWPRIRGLKWGASTHENAA